MAPGKAKVWLFRVLTMIEVPALLGLGLESGLRLIGYGRPTGFLSPDERSGYLRTNPDFAGFFIPANFDLRPLNFRISARKPPDTVRIVVLGESAAQGVPAPAFGFAAQLRAMLRARYPGRKIEVINTGIVAINSHVVYQVARDMAACSPDLFVTYMGNNEVVGPYGPGCAYLSEMPPLWLIRLSIAVKLSRTGQLLAAILAKLPHPAGPPAEWGGMAMFVNNAVRGDDPRLEAVYRNFAANLRDMVRVTTASGAKTLLCTVAANLKDSAPFLSLHRTGMTDAELTAWSVAFERGKIEWLLDETAAARRDLQTALRLDPQYADTAYMLGTEELKSGNLPEARKLLVDAMHWDTLRFRPDPRLNTIIRQVAQENRAGVILVDAAGQLGSDPESTAPPAGHELFFEHVHFDWEGNYQLARLLGQGTEAALGEKMVPSGAWLDSAAVARALAYTGHERPTVLQHVADIVRKPPFTNQLTYVEDQARLARQIAGAEAAAHQPANLQQAKAETAAAIAADPDNPDLMGIAEGIALDQGDLAGALTEARRAVELLPADWRPMADLASLLGQSGKFEEASRLLLAGTGQASDPDKLAPARAALATRMKRFDEGRAYLDRAIARQPANLDYRLMRGNLARIAGNNAAAESEFRGVLRQNPGNEPALEGLVSLLVYLGQAKAAEQASLEFAEGQTRNQLNDLRVARIHEANGDDVQAVRFLQAAEHSGPLDTAVEVSLAKKLHRQNRDGEALLHLAWARRLSLLDGDPEITATIDETIRRLRAAAP